MDKPTWVAKLVEPPGPARAFRGRRVLLVEDDPFDQLVATDLLEVAGATVTVATSAAQALELLQAEPVDAVLVGLDGVQGPGLALVRRLRDEGPAARCPVIAMARQAEGVERQVAIPGAPDVPCALAGIAECIAKPLHPEAMFSALASHMAPRQTAEGEEGEVGAETAERAGSAANAVSVEAGLARCLGRRELYERVVRRFLEQGGRSVQDIGEALERGDRKVAARLAHSLISTAGTLGATPLSEGARALYTALADGGAQVVAQLEALAAEAARVHEALRQYLRLADGDGHR